MAKAKGMVSNMRRRILAGVAAAAMVTGGAIAVTEMPAEAHGNCVLLHLTVNQGTGPDFIHICI